MGMQHTTAHKCLGLDLAIHIDMDTYNGACIYIGLYLGLELGRYLDLYTCVHTYISGCLVHP